MTPSKSPRGRRDISGRPGHPLRGETGCVNRRCYTVKRGGSVVLVCRAGRFPFAEAWPLTRPSGTLSRRERVDSGPCRLNQGG